LKIFQEWGEEGMKENGGGSKFMYNIVRTFVNATMYPHPAQQLKNEKQKAK
jgi:hypothetical protein